MGVVASEERDALLASSGEGHADVKNLDDEGPISIDPTQQLLTTLGRFQRQLARAQTGAQQDLWCDESMNQLILAVEVAIAQGWSDVAEALTDMGRVLQTYENSGIAQDCVPFLNDGYEILCLMVGDLIVDTVRSGVRDSWRERYQVALKDVEAAGLTLVQDDEGEVFGREKAGASEQDSPFELPSLVKERPDEDIGAIDEELPTLDELPPLETLLKEKPAQEIDVSEEIGQDEDSESGSPSDDLSNLASEHERDEPAAVERSDALPSGHSRIIVEILDRICDELSRVESASEEERAISIERLDGGVSALRREAGQGGHEQAEGLCIAMGKVCGLATRGELGLNERFFDLAYAFCGVYMEALSEGATANVERWNGECEALVASRSETPALAAEEEPEAEAEPESPEEAEDLLALMAEPGENEDREEPHSPFGEPGEETEEAAEPAEGDAGTPTLEEFTARGEPDEGVPSETVGEEIDDEGKTSRKLLEAAQRAAAQGDASGAKYYALKAAGSIARAEVIKAKRNVHETEIRLKESWGSAEEARGKVQEAEAQVMTGAAEVTSAEASLEEAHARSSEAGRNLEALDGEVAALEEQIRAMQAQREAEVEKVEAARASLDGVQAQEEQSRNRLDEKKKKEEEGRIHLESSRQKVKEGNRVNAEIEGEMEAARDTLVRQKKSLDDIDRTIEQIGDNEQRAEDTGDSDEMLF